MNHEFILHETRRQFLGRAGHALGALALGSLCGATASPPHFAPRAKRAINLVMAGGPSQHDTWDYKPGLKYDMPLPASVHGGADVQMGMGARHGRYPVAPSVFKFAQHGQSRMWVSELLPWTAKIVDDLTVIRSMHTDSINHDPAITQWLTGNTLAGKPSMGAWLAYGLGSANAKLPTFVVLNSRLAGDDLMPQAIFSRLWGSGFLPASESGVALRSDGGDPVLYLQDPAGMTRARIGQYEMAFRMQASVPELTDLSGESPATFDLYGPKAREPGTFAHNCLLARRMAERGVRFTQIFSRGWDSHTNLPSKDPRLCADVDQACFALVTDLKQRGLLDETLVMWGGEFGRTVYSEGTLTPANYGRDHHTKCFTVWLAGGGVKSGCIHGETDDFSYNIARDPVHVRDLHATILHLFGMDHERLTFKFQGLEQKLTGTVPAKVVRALLA